MKHAGTLLAAAVVVIVLGWLVVVHHLGAPADPYGPCPAGSHYTETWEPSSEYDGGPGPGIQTWFGSTEIASCSGSITISGQSQG